MLPSTKVRSAFPILEGAPLRVLAEPRFNITDSFYAHPK